MADPLSHDAIRGATVEAIRTASAVPLLLAADAILAVDDFTAPDLAHLLVDVAQAGAATAPSSAPESAPEAPRRCAAGALALALSKAQAKARAVAYDRTNNHHNYSYASAEAIIACATAALSGAGLAPVPMSTELVNDTMIRTWKIVHEGGGELVLRQTWPIVKRRGNEADKAVAAACTSSLAYMLRDLLLMPRVEPGADILNDEPAGEHGAEPGYAETERARLERDAGIVRGTHHPEWDADRVAFCAGLRDFAGVHGSPLRYGDVADYLESEGHGRPSWWPTAWRDRFMDRLRAGGFPVLHRPGQ